MDALLKRAVDACTETSMQIRVDLCRDTACGPVGSLTLADVQHLDRVYPGIAGDDTALYRCRAVYDTLYALSRVQGVSVEAGNTTLKLHSDRIGSLASAVEAWPTVFDAAAGRCRNVRNNV